MITYDLNIYIPCGNSDARGFLGFQVSFGGLGLRGVFFLLLLAFLFGIWMM